MALLTKANKEFFIEQVIRNTPALDPSKHVDFFSVPNICKQTVSVGVVNLASRYSNLLIPKILPETLLSEAFIKNTMRLQLQAISVETLNPFLPEHLRVAILAIRKIQAAYNYRMSRANGSAIYLNFNLQVPIYFPEGIPEDYRFNKAESSSAFKKAMLALVDDHEDELLEIKENIEKIVDVIAKTEAIRMQLKSSISNIRTRDKLREAFPKLAKFVPKEKTPTPPSDKVIPSEEQRRYAIIDSLVDLGFNSQPTAT